MATLKPMKNPSRQNLSNWLYGAECYLCDLTDQEAILGLEDEPKLKQSKLNSDEAQRMLHGLATALGFDWVTFIRLLSNAWMKRRKLKCKRLDWYPEEERVAILAASKEKTEGNKTSSAETEV